MAKEYDVKIFLRDIYLDVVIPKRFVWEFMESFGEEFAVTDTHAGKEIRPVKGITLIPTAGMCKLPSVKTRKIIFTHFWKNSVPKEIFLSANQNN